MSRLRSEQGTTLIEVLAAVTVGFVVLAATFGLLESTLRLNSGVMGKTDAMQRGRLALDDVTRQLRSQVCLDFETPAIVAGDASSVTFYADYSSADGQTPPVRRTLSLDTSGGTSYIRSWIYTTTVNPPTKTSYSATPARTELLLENATLQKDAAQQPIPFLRYYEYEKDAGGRPMPTKPVVPPLDSAEAKRVARIEVAYLSRPTGARDDRLGVSMTDEVNVRHADPNAPANPNDPNWVPSPQCI